jgi:hypothetical protein
MLNYNFDNQIFVLSDFIEKKGYPFFANQIVFCKKG